MNQVKTYIDKSSIEGIGLFAGEFIPKGTLIWKPSGLDRIYTKDEYENIKISDFEKDYMKRYTFGKGDLRIFCSDEMRYCNHSDTNPNLGGYLTQIALRDIQPGEEITQDYSELTENFTEEEFKELTSYQLK